LNRRCRIYGNAALIDTRLQEKAFEKSAVLRLDDHIASYPDAPTKRSKEQLILLGDLVSKSIYKGLVVFICGLPRVKMFQLYCDVDKQIKQAVEYAASKGVIFKSINLYLDPYRRKVIVKNLDLPVILKCKQQLVLN